MINLTSTTFANKYIYSTIQDKPLISLERFFLAIGIMILLLTVLLHLFLKEKPTPKSGKKKIILKIRSSL